MLKPIYVAWTANGAPYIKVQSIFWGMGEGGGGHGAPPPPSAYPITSATQKNVANKWNNVPMVPSPSAYSNYWSMSKIWACASHLALATPSPLDMPAWYNVWNVNIAAYMHCWIDKITIFMLTACGLCIQTSHRDLQNIGSMLKFQKCSYYIYSLYLSYEQTPILHMAVYIENITCYLRQHIKSVAYISSYHKVLGWIL